MILMYVFNLKFVLNKSASLTKFNQMVLISNLSNLSHLGNLD